MAAALSAWYDRLTKPITSVRQPVLVKVPELLGRAYAEKPTMELRAPDLRWKMGKRSLGAIG